MATRRTLEEAQELKENLESAIPGETLKIVGRNNEFDVLAVRKCERCGAEVLSAAIGEFGRDLCRACRECEQADSEAHHRERQAGMQRQAQHAEFHDEILNS